jgi:hypothetical protein
VALGNGTGGIVNRQLGERQGLAYLYSTRTSMSTQNSNGGLDSTRGRVAGDSLLAR